MRLSIGFKIGFWLALLGIIATGLMGYYAYYQSRMLLIESSQDKLLTATRVLAQRFTHSLAAVASDVRFVATVPVLKRVGGHGANTRLALRYRQELEGIMSSLMAAHPEYFQIRLIGVAQHGKELVRVDKDEGGVVAVSGSDLQEKGHLPYFFKTIGLPPGEFYISDIRLNQEQGTHLGLGKPTLSIATPVQTGDGSIFGVVVINVDLNYLFNYLRKDLPPEISIVLTNQDGDYLVHPQPAKTFGFDKGLRYRIQDDIPSMALMLERENDFMVLETENIFAPRHTEVAAFVKVPFFPHAEQQFVLLGLLTPLESVLGEVRTLGMSMIQMTLLFSLIAVSISLVFARILSEPLDAMARAMARFSAGEPLVGLPLNRRDEIGFLARSFHSMASRLNARVNEMRNHQQLLGDLAYHDQLTGLPNRLLFRDRLQQTIHKAQRHNSQFALIFVDLDKFKEINDTLGHAAGDEVLKAAAARMQECIRHADTLARLAGDEFIIMLEDLNSTEAAARIAEKILAYFEQPIYVEGKALYLSCSLGISVYPQDGTEAAILVQHADMAMYKAKEQGRKGFCFYCKDLSGVAPDPATGPER